LIRILLDTKPECRIYNVGEPETVTVRDWVQLCYDVVGAPCRMIPVHGDHAQRSYFCFHPYAYQLEVERQEALLPELIPLKEGLIQSWAWYQQHENTVMKRDYLGYIDEHFAGQDRD